MRLTSFVVIFTVLVASSAFSLASPTPYPISKDSNNNNPKNETSPTAQSECLTKCAETVPITSCSSTDYACLCEEYILLGEYNRCAQKECGVSEEGYQGYFYDMCQGTDIIPSGLLDLPPAPSAPVAPGAHGAHGA